MKNTLVGRENERAILLKALQSDESEMVAVLGRRRVGKTFLVSPFYANPETGISECHQYIRLATQSA